MLVEAVQPEVGGVDHVGLPLEGEVGGGLGDAGTPHHAVPTGTGDH